MLENQNDRICPQTSGDQSANRSLIDMADPHEQRAYQTARCTDANGGGTSQDSGFLQFNDPFTRPEHHHHGHHHHRHHEHSNYSDHKTATDHLTNSLSSSDLDKMSIQQLEALAAQLVQALEKQIGGLQSPTTDTAYGADVPTTKPTVEPIPDQTKATPAEQPSTAPVDQPVTNTVDQPTRPPVDQPTTGTTTAETGKLDAVMSQSPNATGPIAFDATVNNASVVGFVGPTAGATVDRSAQVEFKDMKSYVHLKTGGWLQIEDQSKSEIIGGNWKDDMKGESKNMTVRNAPNDATMDAPPAGYIDHFWLHDGGGTIDPSKVDGFFSTAEARASVPNSGLSASLGVDWFKTDGTSDGRFGTGKALTDQWQPLYHSTLDRQTLANDPPPGISATTTDSPAATVTKSPSDSSTIAQSGTATTSAKLINLFPQSDAQWQQIINDAPTGSIIVSESAADVNPKYDMPFDTIDPALKQHISDAAAAGMKPLGYVGTANGTKPLEVAKAEIDSWYKNADVQGIYVGNSGKADDSGYATDTASKAYFIELGNYIKAKGGMAVINGSGTPVQDYADIYDVQGTVEGSIQDYGKYPEAAWQANYSADHFSAVLGGVPLSDLKRVEREVMAKNNGYIAIADSYPNPMTTEYWNAEIQGLQQS
ncbi:MAG: hypothetical protein JSS83_13520 [Cyanobacteria bacterium SZAS LIN-3]|nr:hypothetical protein [Cyanobacteria bacterium SZAS LIN-3]